MFRHKTCAGLQKFLLCDCWSSMHCILSKWWRIHSHIGGEDSVDEVLLREVEGALQLMVVEGNISRAGTVQSSLHEGGPCVFQQETTTDVILTHAGHTREDSLPTILLYCVLSKKEVCEAAHLIRRDKVRLCGEKGKEDDRIYYYQNNFFQYIAINRCVTHKTVSKSHFTPKSEDISILL